jgi:hypothetical protein
MFALMLIWVFIISISTAEVGGNLKIDDPAVKYDLHPKIESGLLENEQGTGRQDVFGAQIQSLSTKKVVFELNDSDKSYIKSLEDSGASIEIVYENLVQASVPLSQLQVMSDLPFVKYVRSPTKPYIQTISEGVGVINATPLNNLGIRGQGVIIAVIDVGFAGYNHICMW